MQPVDKESKRQRLIEQENKRLDEAAKKKQKRQLEEINRLEQIANRKLEKEKKKEHQRAIEINRLEHVVKKKAPLSVKEVKSFEQQAEYIRFITGNEPKQVEMQKKQKCQQAVEINQLEHDVKMKAKLTMNERNKQVIHAESIRIRIANEVDNLQYQANRGVRHEVKHLQQQSNRAQLIHDVSTNEAIHLQQVTYQHQHNRASEYERLDNHNEIENIGDYGNEFKLRNPQLSMQEAVNFLNLKDPLQHKWSDFEKSPVKSLLLWYANAGCFAFDEYKEYSMAFNGQQMDVKGLEKEIGNEALSDQELRDIIKKFSVNHSYTDGNLYACGACGMRQLEQLYPKIEYVSIPLMHDLLKSLQYTDDEKNGFRNEQQLHALQVPCDDQGHFMTLQAWKVKSVYEARSGILYHLHPELIDIGEAGIESVRLHPACLSKLK